jgi:parallel beta-helix repeat protein
MNGATGACIYVAQSDGTRITNNKVHDTVVGKAIWINSGDNCSVTFNDLGLNSDGIMIHNGWFNLIENNSIYRSNGYGIYLSEAKNNTIIHNEIYNNSNYGVYIVTNSVNNTLHHNNLYSNGQSTSQGYDTSSGGNIWDNGTHGNYWNDYNGTDGDGDGIGDTPYNLGGGNNTDAYPLMNSSSNGVPVPVPEMPILPVTFMIVTLIIAIDQRKRRRN